MLTKEKYKIDKEKFNNCLMKSGLTTKQLANKADTDRGWIYQLYDRKMTNKNCSYPLMKSIITVFKENGVNIQVDELFYKNERGGVAKKT